MKIIFFPTLICLLITFHVGFGSENRGVTMGSSVSPIVVQSSDLAHWFGLTEGLRSHIEAAVILLPPQSIEKECALAAAKTSIAQDEGLGMRPKISVSPESCSPEKEEIFLAVAQYRRNVILDAFKQNRTKQ